MGTNVTRITNVTTIRTWTAALLANNNPMPLSSPSYSIKIPLTFILVVLTHISLTSWNISIFQYWHFTTVVVLQNQKTLIIIINNSLVCDYCLVPATLVVVLLDVFLLQRWKMSEFKSSVFHQSALLIYLQLSIHPCLKVFVFSRKCQYL